jgi:hypothetical protein
MSSLLLSSKGSSHTKSHSLNFSKFAFDYICLIQVNNKSGRDNYKLSPGVSQDKKLTSSQATHQVRLFPDTVEFIKALIAIPNKPSTKFSL